MPSGLGARSVSTRQAHLGRVKDKEEKEDTTAGIPKRIPPVAKRREDELRLCSDSR